MRDVLFNDPKLTFSKLCAGWLLRLDPRMQVKGFSRDLCKAVALTYSQGEAEDLRELIETNRIIPDAHIIDKKLRTAYLFEIEDTNPLSADKLRKISEIWFRLDCLDWEMRVFLIDRYLTCWRSLPLADVYFSLAYPDPRKKNSDRQRQQGTAKFDWEATHKQASKTAINRPISIRTGRSDALRI